MEVLQEEWSQEAAPQVEQQAAMRREAVLPAEAQVARRLGEAQQVALQQVALQQVALQQVARHREAVLPAEVQQVGRREAVPAEAPRAASRAEALEEPQAEVRARHHSESTRST